MTRSTKRLTGKQALLSEERADALYQEKEVVTKVNAPSVDFNAAAYRREIGRMEIAGINFKNGPAMSNGIDFVVYTCTPYGANNFIQQLRSADADSATVAVETWERVVEGAITAAPTSVTNWRKVVYAGGAAIDTVTDSDLTANRVLISNGSGKIAATSTITPAELESLKPYKYIGGGSYSTKTLTVCSDLRGFKVWFDVTSSTISLKIKNSATGNLTANGVISAGGEGSSDGGGWYEDISGSSDYTIESLSKGQISDSSNNASKAGVVLFSVKNSASTRHAALHYAMHNTDADEYAVYCRVE